MKRVAVAMSLVVLAGCGTTIVHEVPFRALTPHSHEVLLYPEAVPDAPYADAGLVQAFGYGLDSTPEHLQRALQTAGQHMGCDAIARVRIDTTDAGESHAIGVCVIWQR